MSPWYLFLVGTLCQKSQWASDCQPYLQELAEEETRSGEAGADPGVAGRKRLFGLQGVLE